MRLLHLGIPALVTVAVGIGFSINFHKEARQEWNAFEKKFESTSLAISTPKSSVIRSEVQDEVKGIQEVNLEQAMELQNEIQNEIQEEVAYQPTSRDPLHFIDSSVTGSAHFESITNFNLDELDLIDAAKDQRDELAAVGQTLMQNLIDCMSSGQCIEELGSEYEHISEMRSHQLLERTLYIALALQDFDPEANMLNHQQMMTILSMESPSLHYVALEMLSTRSLNDQQFTDLLGMASSIPSESRGHLFSQIENQTRGQARWRPAYIEALKNELAHSPNTAVEIMKHLPFISLDQQELTLVTQGLCSHRRADTDSEQHWEMIRFHHGQYTELKGVAVDLGSVCR
jgi:hypothetical protein